MTLMLLETARIDTIEKNSAELIAFPGKTEFGILFYVRFLSSASVLFPNIEVILFESLKHQPLQYFTELSDFFGIQEDFVESNFTKRKENVRSKVSGGEVSQAVTLDQKIEKQINKNIISFLKSQLWLNKVYNRILKISRSVTTSKEVVHPKLNKQKIDEVLELITADNASLVKFGLNKGLLGKYGYE
jgi:hypothetical protein